MRLDNHGYVSIVELIVYIPCLILGFMVCLRHGFKRGSGWIFILILSAIRIAGSICQLLTYNNPTEGLFKATAILESIGIAPLLLVVLGVLSRFVGWINSSGQSPKFNMKLFRILQVFTGIGLILGIIGVSSGGSQAANGAFIPSAASKVGIVVYIAVLAAITIIFIMLLSNVSAVPRPERPLIVYIPIAVLAMAVRLLYSVLCIYVHDSKFSLFGGSIVADVLMAIVEEFLVVIITLVLGFKLDRISSLVEGEAMNHNLTSRNQSQQLPGSKGGFVTVSSVWRWTEFPFSSSEASGTSIGVGPPQPRQQDYQVVGEMDAAVGVVDGFIGAE